MAKGSIMALSHNVHFLILTGHHVTSGGNGLERSVILGVVGAVARLKFVVRRAVASEVPLGHMLKAGTLLL